MIPRCDLVIEAASPTAVGELLPKVIAHRKAMLCMSTGGLLGFPKLLAQAVAHRVPVYLPSGALAGIDGIKAASQGKLHSVTLTTRKPPSAFAGAPGVLRRKSRWNHPSKPRLLFKGPAERAVREFPQNINVAATLSLAGIGPARTKVRVIADPSLKENIHEVEATGPFGKLFVRMENRPSSRNPKTSQIAILSAIATLKQVVTSVKVGT